MPELPDVEGFRRYFRRHAAGKRVRRVEADPHIVRDTSPEELVRAIEGRRLGDPERQGKWLVCPVDGSALVLHFGMTGSLVWSGSEPARHPHDRMHLQLDDGELRYRSMRKLGGVWLLGAGDDLEAVTGPLGPDALRASPGEFVERLSGRRGGVKAALMDQSTLSGLGNLTVDEILWRARVHPRRAVADLDPSDLRRLERKTKDVLRMSVKEGRVPGRRSWLTGRRGSRDAACPRCGESLASETVAGRTTYLCPGCQG